MLRSSSDTAPVGAPSASSGTSLSRTGAACSWRVLPSRTVVLREGEMRYRSPHGIIFGMSFCAWIFSPVAWFPQPNERVKVRNDLKGAEHQRVALQDPPRRVVTANGLIGPSRITWPELNARYAGVFMLMRASACHVLVHDHCWQSTTILRASCHVGTHPPMRGVRSETDIFGCIQPQTFEKFAFRPSHARSALASRTGFVAIISHSSCLNSSLYNPRSTCDSALHFRDSDICLPKLIHLH